MAPEEDIVIGKHGERRLKGKELSIPVVVGTVAFYLGKKVVFVLHPSFNNPERGMEYPPWELTETGWGEFDVNMQIHFHDDAHLDGPIDIFHRLRLYDEAGVNNAKKPVVSETYEEVVLWEPSEEFYNRVSEHKPRPAPPTQLSQYYTAFSPEAEYRRIQAARQRVAQITANVKAQLAQIDAQ